MCFKNLFLNRQKNNFNKTLFSGHKSRKMSFLLGHGISERGSALMMAVFFMTVAVILMTVGASLISSVSRQVQKQNTYVAVAENVARAGISDALEWFVRQNRLVTSYIANYAPGAVPTFAVSPKSGVTFTYVDQAFEPQFSYTSYDTTNPAIGIVKDYPLDNPDPNLALYFGHYEVRREYNPPTPGTPYPNPVAVHDITGDRNSSEVNGDGVYWYLTSVGTVYKRLDKTKSVQNGITVWNVSYNVGPNVVVATSTMSQELRKLTLNMPVTAGCNQWGAVYCENPTQVTFMNTQTLVSAGAGVTVNAFVYDNP
jgi:hypothetical protein